jgi:hypothetical protein
MAFETITQLVRSLAGDGSRSGQLREDPLGLAARHGLGPRGVAALTGVDRFFQTEKPILQASVRRVARVFSPPPQVLIPVEPGTKSTLVASSDTGTLLPGPNTGSFSATGTVSHTVLAPAPATPGPKGPAAPGPAVPGGPIAPGIPSGPTGPVPFAPGPMMPGGPSPWGPIPPAGPIPMGPSPYGPGGPGVPGPFPSPSPSGPEGPSPYGPGALTAACAGCGCEAAVVAINALVAATSQASLTAIAAIAAQSRRSHG